MGDAGKMSNSSARIVERNEAAALIAHNEFLTIERRYGSAKTAPLSGVWLPYHGVSHTREAHEAAFQTAQLLVSAGRLDPAYVPLVRIAAAYHDHEQDRVPGANECASADAATAAMTDARFARDFSERDREFVRAAIMATVIQFDDRGRLRQSVNMSGDPARILTEMIMADADLVSLGTPDGPRQGLVLQLEIQALAGKLDLPRTVAGLMAVELPEDVLERGLAGQARLFATHRYELDLNNEVLGPQQQRNTEFVASLGQRFREGENFSRLLKSTVVYSTSLGAVGLDG